jgi:hypothetical protein
LILKKPDNKVPGCVYKELQILAFKDNLKIVLDLLEFELTPGIKPLSQEAAG